MHRIRLSEFLVAEANPPNDEVIEQGLVPRLVEFLKEDTHPKLQFEAAWALTNVASGTSEHTQVVVDNNAIPSFVRLMHSPDEDLRQQAAWGLANIAGDSFQNCDRVLDAGALQPLLKDLKGDPIELSVLCTSTWVLSSFCRGGPEQNFEFICDCLPVLARHIHSDNKEVLTNVCWALTYLLVGPNDRIAKVIESGVCRRLVELLLHPTSTVVVPAVRAVSNIATGSNSQTQVIINCGVLPKIVRLVETDQIEINKKDICTLLGNVTGGTEEQIQGVIDAGLIPSLVQFIRTDDLDVARDAARALRNAASGGSPSQIKYLVSCGLIDPVCDLLDSSDLLIVRIALDILGYSLNWGSLETKACNGINPYAILVDEARGIDKIKRLRKDDDGDVRHRACTVFKIFFESYESSASKREEITVVTPGREHEDRFVGGGDSGNDVEPSHSIAKALEKPLRQMTMKD